MVPLRPLCRFDGPGADLTRLPRTERDAFGSEREASVVLVLEKGQPSLRQIGFWDSTVIPISRVLDRVVRHSFGRSGVAVYRRD